MAVEEISARLRARLQAEYGVDEAAILMDHTEFEARLGARFDAIDRRFDLIDRKFEGVEGRIILELHRELRVQTWRFVTTTIAALTSLTGATAIFVAIATSH